MLPAERIELGQARKAAQRENAIALGMTRNDIQRTEADGTGGPQYGDALRRIHDAPQPASQSSAANSGIAAVRLSMRSSTPP